MSDKDGTGMRSVPQLRYMIQCLGDPLEDEEADQFIVLADKEKAGAVKYEDFVDAMFDGSPKNRALMRRPGLPIAYKNVRITCCDLQSMSLEHVWPRLSRFSMPGLLSRVLARFPW
ncbi:unnamed protein product [Prorocentrum cordatum]|uniref:EF-hand domain-containing protein n=1 Tax=Prorocentrum cordatum TaxID=2364126 RepID=A0ABN9WIK7_9DINO|nr:unnamed protein product [Polarella glacialis]